MKSKPLPILPGRFARHFIFLTACLLCVAPATGQTPTGDTLAQLRTVHPRLLVLDDQLQIDKQLIQTNPEARETFAKLKLQADKMLTQASVQHVLIGPRLLQQSRNALSLISTTAGMYRLTGEVKYADRAKKELLVIAGFNDWNPSHFLDVAEMTNAAGIGYDWIYDQLSAEDRKIIRTAIIEKGLNEGLKQYQKHTFWTDCNHNWGQVCAGGLTVGALAIANEQPDLAREILSLTRKTMLKPMQQFSPDGGWDEGPGYWNYATSYNVFYLSAIETALGTDYGFKALEGFASTASFHIQMTGPTKKVFNFADAGDELGTAPQMFWLAKKFNHPMEAAWERASSAGHMNIFHLLWFNPEGSLTGTEAASPLDACFKRVNVGVMRSSWSDPDAWYIAFKGGDNAANHSHLDLGTFVLDAMGQRWALDLGPDNYNLPGYFGKQRFTYFRLMTKAHNTLSASDENQPVKAKAAITHFQTSQTQTASVIDLSAAYPTFKSVHRGIAMLNRKQILIQDEIEADESVQFAWNFHTAASIQLDGKSAILSQNGKAIRATLLSPGDAKFETANCQIDPPQKANVGITNLMVRGKGTSRVMVLFSAVDDARVPEISGLSMWGKK